ncbi:MAG: zinc-binding dehydrogenase [Aeromicrobium sp.]|uniref:zinc-binding dehydrogenase n=1 Tax=Aeromicrobium sp. TaxID=1871063 RepID=UPI003C4C39A5
MFAVYVERTDSADPLGALVIGERPAPAAAEGWTTVRVAAASINHHDVWSLRGVGLKDEFLPMILGCDAAGFDEDGNEVIVHGVISTPDWTGDETLDPDRTLLSERHQGTFAEYVTVPRRNVVPKPAGLSFGEAACLPTAWLTAYRMLFTQADLSPGDTVLVQGAGGGMSTSLIMLARAAGFRVLVTSRDAGSRGRALEIGAHETFESGERLPDRVDAVMETIGRATWSHSVKSVRSGGTIVISGATSGDATAAELQHIFFRQIKVHGSTMGTRDELEALARFMAETGTRPLVEQVLSMDQAADGIRAVKDGDVFGKVVLTLS